ncbi:hypothetical protein ACFYW6_39435 [Streptomyces sp. NPDC002659]|uniref:hypothetical protein n=1 Tax=Streptomyces sp. NPDC002659 TaxID=3364656 RepID=UPI003688E246
MKSRPNESGDLAAAGSATVVRFAAKPQPGDAGGLHEPGDFLVVDPVALSLSSAVILGTP